MLLLAVTIVAGVWRPTLAAARQAEGEAGAELTVVHGLADGGPVDLTIDGGAAFFGAGFASRSDPIRLPAGRHELRFTPTGEASGTSLIQGEIEVEPDVPLIVALLGTTSEPRLFAYRVDRSPLAAEDARVRVIHGAADAGGVDVALSGGDLLFPPLAFAEATDYAEIEPGSYDLELRAEATDEVLLALADTELAAGRVTDIVVVGSVADGSLQALSVTTGAETAASGTERRGRLRA
jgi:hypothetical protein